MGREIGADLVDIVGDQRRVGKDFRIDLLQDKVSLLTPDEPGTIDEAATVRDDLAGIVVEAICRKDRVQHGRVFVGEVKLPKNLLEFMRKRLRHYFLE